MILIYPPVAKACEPPAGIAKLSGALGQHGIRHCVLDGNLEGQLFLMEAASKNRTGKFDTWTSRAMRNLSRNLSAIKDKHTYRSIDRYRRAVMDINRVLEKSVSADGVTISLANYQHDGLSPLRSEDLLKAAEHSESNPFFPYFKGRLSALIEERQPGTIGISLCYLSQALCSFAILGYLRKNYPGLKLICGGGLVTSWLRGPGRNGMLQKLFAGLVDHFVEGPGENALLSLAGINSDHAHYSPGCDFASGDYFSPGGVLPYSASSGCFWNRCSFCPEKAEGNCYVPVGIRKSITDISLLVQRMQPALIHLLDNSVSIALMKSLVKNPPGVPWYGFARIEDELADPDFCNALKRSGCVMLKLGVESGDQSVLDSMQKGIDLQTASAALKALHRAGIAAYVYLLFGTPGETIAGARRTLEFTATHSSEIGFLNLAIFNMPANSPEAQALKTSCFYEGDLSLYMDFEHPRGWNRKVVRQFIESEFKRHPAISSILINEPPFFTSNHAAFLCIRE